MKHYPTLDIIVAILLVVGGLNMGINALTGYDVIHEVFQGFANVIAILIGLAGAYRVLVWFKAKAIK